MSGTGWNVEVVKDIFDDFCFIQIAFGLTAATKNAD